MTDIKIYEVGGAVRDFFRGLKNNDIDFAIEAPSYQDMKNYVIASGASIFIEHPEFVTIRAKWSPPGYTKFVACDFTLCRKEGEYHDNRHPSNIEPGTIYEDLARRDFTMNAIARNINTGELIDPFNGIKDIKDNIIRSVGNPEDRFQEDALRMLRALRFQVVLNFDVCSNILDAIVNNISLLDKISASRIRDELHKMFNHNTIYAMKVLSYFSHDELNHIFNDRTKIWLEPTMKDK